MRFTLSALVAPRSLSAAVALSLVVAGTAGAQERAAVALTAPAVTAALVAPARDMSAPTASLAFTGTGESRSMNDSSRTLLVAPRAAALTRLRQNSTEPLPAPAPFKRETGSTRTNTALMIVGASAIILGAAVGDDAGTVLIVGGAGVGLYGLYRFLN